MALIKFLVNDSRQAFQDIKFYVLSSNWNRVLNKTFFMSPFLKPISGIKIILLFQDVITLCFFLIMEFNKKQKTRFDLFEKFNTGIINEYSA